MWFRSDLPAEFHDRRPWWLRLRYHFEILFQMRTIKTNCCESYLIPNDTCCKGCARLYSPTATNPLHRFLWRVAKKKINIVEPRK